MVKMPRPKRALPKPPLLVRLALVLLLIVLLLAAVGEWLAPKPFDIPDIEHAFLPPAFSPGGSPEFVLGTDFLGRDLFSRLLYSIRLTVVISILGTLFAAGLGSTVGIIAGYQRGWVEDLVMMGVDLQASLPFIVFALTILALFGNSFAVLLLIASLNGWDNFARLARALVLSVSTQEYVLAAKSLGITTPALYWRHILPNIASALVVELSLNLASTIMLETALSFLGLGVQVPMTSLGQMLGEGRDYLLFAPWMSLVPGTTIFLIVICVSIVGDWLRDVLDPRTRLLRP